MAKSSLLSLFDFDGFPPSIERLPAAMTINGTTVYPTFRYKGGDAAAAGWAQWGYGTPLSISGSGTVPTYNNGSPLLGTVDDSVKFNGSGGASATGRTFASAETSVGNLGLNDFVVEIVVRVPSSLDVVCCKNGEGNGFQCYFSGGAIYCDFYGGGYGPTSAANTTGSILHAICFQDRSGSAQWYVNGIASGSAANISGGVAISLDNATPLGISGYPAGGAQYHYAMSDALYYCALWQGASWLDTHLQATVAKTRFAQLTGTYPIQARGTALPATISGRTTAGYVDKRESNGTTKLYYMGAYWPRSVSRLNGNSSRVVKGYLSEAAATNSAKQSRTFNTTWDKYACTVPGTSVTRLDGIAGTENTIHEDGTTAIHYLDYPSNAAMTAGTVYCVSICGKAGSRGRARLTAFDGVDDHHGVFNFSLGTTISKTANVSTYGVYSLGNGWYRAWFTFTAAITIAHEVAVVLRSDDTTETYAGTDSDSLYIDCLMVETGSYPSSYVPTTTAAVTRTADSLVYTMSGGNLTAGQGALTCDFLGPNANPASEPITWTISDGTAANRIYLDRAGASNYQHCTFGGTVSSVEQWGIDGTTHTYDGNVHTINETWQTNKIDQYVDGAADGTEDTSATIPTVTQLNVGGYLSAGYECNAVLTNLDVGYPITLNRTDRSFAGPTLALFDFDRFPPSVERLPAAMTINSTTVYPTFRYKGGDANGTNWVPWGYGETLTLQAGTAPTYNNGSPLLGKLDDGVLFNGGGYYQSTSLTVGDINLDDFVLEMVLSFEASKYVASKIKIAAPVYGWRMETTTNSVSIYLWYNNTPLTITTATSFTTGAIYCLHLFVDRSGSAQWYVNGVASGSAVDVSSFVSSDIDATTKYLAIGSDSDSAGGAPYTGKFFHFVQYQSASWLDTHLQATVAQTRFAQLTGVYPQQARGTALPTTIAGRTTAGYVDKRESNGTTKLYYTGAYWPRSCSRLNGNSSRVVKGYLSETAETCSAPTNNTALNGTEYSNNTQTLNAAVAPDGTTTMTQLVEKTSASSFHGRYMGTTIAMVLNDIVSVSGYIRKGDRCAGVGLICLDHGVPVAVLINPATGATGYYSNTHIEYVAGTVGSESLGNDTYRLWGQIKCTWAGGETVAPAIFLASDITNVLGTIQFAGDAVTYPTGAYFWGLQAVKATITRPGSFIKTTSGAVTRTADSLTYPGGANALTTQGTVAFDVLAPSATFTAEEMYTDIVGTAGGNIRLATSYVTVANEMYFYGTIGWSVLSGATTVKDGNAHTVRGTWQTNAAALYRDSVSQGTPATSVTVPTDPSTAIRIGWNGASAQPNALITNFRVFGIPTLKG